MAHLRLVYQVINRATERKYSRRRAERIVITARYAVWLDSSILIVLYKLCRYFEWSCGASGSPSHNMHVSALALNTLATHPVQT